MEIASCGGRQQISGRECLTQVQRRDGSDETATLRKLLRMGHNLICTVATLPLRSGDFDFDPDSKASKRLEHTILLNFIISSWQSEAGIRERDLNHEAVGTVSRYYEYVSSVDDLMDTPSKDGLRLDFMKDERIRNIRKGLFSSISKTRNENEIRRTIAESGDVMMEAMSRLKAGGVPDMESALRLRCETTGEVMRTAVSILGAAHDIPRKVSSTMERNYVNLAMALQISDDMTDFAKDMKDGIAENLIFQILRQHPLELESIERQLSRSSGMGRNQFGKLAPESLRAARELQEGFLGKIPDSPDYYGTKILMRMKFGV